MFKNSRVLRLGLMVAVLATALISPAAVSASHGPKYTVAHNPDAALNMNEGPFWEAFLAQNEGGNWTCVKSPIQNTDPTIGPGGVDALIIKAGQNNFVWVPAHEGTYTPPGQNGTSHFIICDKEDAQAPIPPTGEIEGPCNDPAYYATFDNSNSTVDIKFRFYWFTRTWPGGEMNLNYLQRTVDAGRVFKTAERWVSNFTWMRITYKDPITGEWKLLDREKSTKGTFPACVYQRGYQTDQS